LWKTEYQKLNNFGRDRQLTESQKLKTQEKVDALA